MVVRPHDLLDLAAERFLEQPTLNQSIDKADIESAFFVVIGKDQIVPWDDAVLFIGMHFPVVAGAVTGVGHHAGVLPIDGFSVTAAPDGEIRTGDFAIHKDALFVSGIGVEEFEAAEDHEFGFGADEDAAGRFVDQVLGAEGVAEGHAIYEGAGCAGAVGGGLRAMRFLERLVGFPRHEHFGGQIFVWSA